MERGNDKLKWIDRQVGKPLVRVLGALRNKKKISKDFNPKRIAILSTAALGDSLILSPVLQDIKKKYPDCKLTVFAAANNKAMFEFFDFIDELKIISIKNPFKAISDIRASGRFDAFIDTGQWARLNSLLTHAAKAELKIGFETEGQDRHYVFDIAVPHSRDGHELDNFRKLGKAIGVDSKSMPSLKINSTERKRQIAIHMFASGAGANQKEWPFERWVPVIDHLTSSGYSVHLTGVQTDFDKAQKVFEKCHSTEMVFNQAGRLSLKETAKLLAESAFMLSVNTGTLHIGAALGCPVIAVMGPTADRWGPLAKQNVIVRSTLPCSPCLYLGFDYGCPLASCMEEITVPRVLEAIKKLEKQIQDSK